MFKDKSLLIVEDDIEFGTLLKDLLSEDFNKVYFAKNADEGFNTFTHLLPDIVLSDINLPKMDGLEFVEKLLKINSSQNIMLMTGYTNHYHTKVSNYNVFKKPLEIELLYESFEKLLRN